jgi:hypothetical protein
MPSLVTITGTITASSLASQRQGCTHNTTTTTHHLSPPTSPVLTHKDAPWLWPTPTHNSQCNNDNDGCTLGLSLTDDNDATPPTLGPLDPPIPTCSSANVNTNTDNVFAVRIHLCMRMVAVVRSRMMGAPLPLSTNDVLARPRPLPTHLPTNANTLMTCSYLSGCGCAPLPSIPAGNAGTMTVNP